MIIWLTGQPGSGKTVLAGWLQSITEINSRVMQIDGDDIREIFQNKDYSEAGRRKNIELAQKLALFLHKKKYTVIVSLVSPYRDQREDFKARLGDDIKELYVHTTEDRGRNHFHVDNYESPLENFIDVDTTNEKPIDTYKKIKEKLGYL